MKQKDLLIPLNLQFFASGEGEGSPDSTSGANPEDATTPNAENGSETVTTKEAPKTEKEVDVQSLLTELAKTKRALDKASSEAASYKKQYKETLSEKEQYDLEAAEAKAKHDEEFEALKAKVAISELKDQFVALGYSVEQANTAAKAQYENDVETLLKVQQQFTADRIEAEKQKILAEMPQPNIGAGNSQTYTKEQFENMSMADRTKLLHEDKAEYDRLNNL